MAAVGNALNRFMPTGTIQYTHRDDGKSFGEMHGCTNDAVQGYLAHQKQPPPIGLPDDHRYSPTVVSQKGGVSYERGIPVHESRQTYLVKVIDCCSAGFRVQGSWCMAHDSGLRVQGSGFRAQGSGSRVQGSGFRVQSSGFMVHGSWFRAQGSRAGFKVSS